MDDWIKAFREVGLPVVELFAVAWFLTVKVWPFLISFTERWLTIQKDQWTLLHDLLLNAMKQLEAVNQTALQSRDKETLTLLMRLDPLTASMENLAERMGHLISDQEQVINFLKIQFGDRRKELK